MTQTILLLFRRPGHWEETCNMETAQTPTKDATKTAKLTPGPVWGNALTYRLAQEYVKRESRLRAEFSPGFTAKDKKKLWEEIVGIINRWDQVSNDDCRVW